MTLGLFYTFDSVALVKAMVDLTLTFAGGASPFLVYLFNEDQFLRIDSNNIGYGFGAGVVMMIYWFKIPFLIP